MNRLLGNHTLTLILIVLLTAGLAADVKQKKKTEFKFSGTIGTVMKLFGAGKPVYTMEYLSGNSYRQDSMDKKGKKVESSQIILLDEEVLINIDHKKKKYTKMTFEEWREYIDNGLGQIFNQQPAEGGPESGQEMPEAKLNVTVNIDTPGDTKKYADHQTENVILTLKSS